jgi:hypothetical protein
VPQELDPCLAFLPPDAVEACGERPFVAIVRSRAELGRWLNDPPSGLQWLQVEGLLGDAEAWALASQGNDEVPLDVVLGAPATEFADLYRLVDVHAVRAVRVSMPALPGFLKALRLAASLKLPVRLLPGQPSPETLRELAQALAFYLHDPMVEAPVEFFHSVLASMRSAEPQSLWIILEEDPSAFRHRSGEGPTTRARLLNARSAGEAPAGFVEGRLRRLVEQGAECATCSWQAICRGYFKWPDPAYCCGGVKGLFSTLQAAADELAQELGDDEGTPPTNAGAEFPGGDAPGRGS